MFEGINVLDRRLPGGDSGGVLFVALFLFRHVFGFDLYNQLQKLFRSISMIGLLR